MTSSFPSTRLPDRPVRATLTRFAPAPTGWLHLGHVLNACYVWNTARALDCRVLLRIEDHDRERCRPEYERAVLDDLDWLGFVADVYSTECYRNGPCEGRQSDRGAVYRTAVATLLERDLVYACDCSRRALAAADSPAAIERPYPGRCRTRGLPIVDGVGWRLKVSDTPEEFTDLLLGRHLQRPADQCGDFLIRDRLGNWTYQFAVAVDDYMQGIDLVIRGTDLLASTGRQMHLARLLGRPMPPAFMHHPLIMTPAGRKLSKADGDTAIRQLRADGWTPDRIFEEVARLAGG